MYKYLIISFLCLFYVQFGLLQNEKALLCSSFVGKFSVNHFILKEIAIVLSMSFFTISVGP